MTEVNFKNDFTLLEIKLGDKKHTFCQQDSDSRNILFCGDGPGGRMTAQHNCFRPGSNIISQRELC